MMKTNMDYISRYELLPVGCSVLCALSGGRDSVYLLYRLLEWAEQLQLTVYAAHYNHHLRGEESLRDENFVRDLCNRLQVPLVVGNGDVRAYAREHGKGIEESARILRYEFLEETRIAVGADVIATAHHADDLAETMLFQLARGSGARGLSGIPPKRGHIVRPILLTARREIDAYLDVNDIAYVDDSTNEEDDGSRNLIRHHVMPVLQSINPAFVSHAARAAMLLREDDAYIQLQAEAFLDEHLPQDGIEGKALLALAEPVASRVIRSVWGSGLQHEHVQQILELCRQNETRYTHVPGSAIRYDSGRLWTDETIGDCAEMLLCGDRGECRYGGFHIRWETRTYSDEIHNSLNTFCLKYENMNGVVTVSPRRSGDRVKFMGSAHTKKLKKLFLEHKFTQPQRAAIPVFRDEQGIVAVYGFGIAQHCVPEIGDKIIYIKCDKQREKWWII